MEFVKDALKEVKRLWFVLSIDFFISLYSKDTWASVNRIVTDR
jgi:hypothetical protein